MKHKSSYDFYLILATVLVLFAISLISIYGMFYFKFAQILQMEPAVKMAYMNRMNSFVAPFVIILILLLGICVPKRLLPAAWLNRITALLIIPAASARTYASTPERMALLSMAIGALSAIGGLRLAVMLDVAVGPAIICVAAGIFAVSTIGKELKRIGG